MSSFKPLDWEASLPILTKEELERLNKFLSSPLMNAPEPLSASDGAAAITTSDHTTIAAMPVNPYYNAPAIPGVTNAQQSASLALYVDSSSATFEASPPSGVRFAIEGNSHPVWSLSDLWEIVHSFASVELDTGLTVDETVENLVQTIIANHDKLPIRFTPPLPF